jgi:LysM repeat protein/outer membrane protein assembly factor BamB
MISFIFLNVLIFANLSASAEVNVPLNVDLKQKITTDLVSFSENNNSVVQNHTIYIPERQGNKITAVNALDGRIKWEYNTNAATAYYQFTGVNDVLFFQANGTLIALKDNGTEATVLWTKPYQASSFTIDGATLYFFKGGKLAAIDVLTGAEKWEYALPNREKPHSNIAIGNGKIFFVTDNQMDMEHKMYALNAATAQALWTTTNVDYYAQKLSYVDGKIYVKSYKEMNAFDSNNGLFLWKFLVQENFDFEMNANIIFTKTSDGNVAAYDRVTKALRWKYKAGSFSRGPIIVTPTHILVNGDGAIKWLDIQNGQLVRTMTAPGVNYQPLTAVDGALVAIDNSNNLYYYTAASDTVKPNLVLDSVPGRFSSYDGNNAKISFNLSEDAYVKMTVKNSQGQAIRTIDFGLLNQGWNYKYWDGKDGNGQLVPYGEYTLSFQVKDLSGNEVVAENTAKKINIADVRGTTVEETISRKGPGTSYEILTTIPTGTQLTILDETTEWFKVNFSIDSRGYEGYVQKSAVATRSNPNPKASSNNENTTVTYTVQSGDTLWKIAQKFGVTTQAIVEANNLDPTKYLYVGQKLMIPGKVSQPEQPTSTITYTVQSGDTLWKIAQKHGVTTQAIIDANKLDPTKYLYVGQKLIIPSTTKPVQSTTVTYTVQSGDTLWKVAQKYGVTIQAIVEANKLDPTKYLYVGQKLIIPVK